ncbi:DeoR family transcriptional regulator [Pseudoduganella chitinolytica]|uniref:DeoR family transcriptional regulator n=1 Tax=Pseudoduganella chitinolytica TaxID=34070 RepID=A0ABY8BA65_9BURK|nr:DeoR family transcriptional regulator [Pseudoduganella chitinolytica]
MHKLVAHRSVTTQTIPPDIRELEDERLLARYHGGVSIPPRAGLPAA